MTIEREAETSTEREIYDLNPTDGHLSSRGSVSAPLSTSQRVDTARSRSSRTRAPPSRRFAARGPHRPISSRAFGSARPSARPATRSAPSVRALNTNAVSDAATGDIHTDRHIDIQTMPLRHFTQDTHTHTSVVSMLVQSRHRGLYFVRADAAHVFFAHNKVR